MTKFSSIKNFYLTGLLVFGSSFLDAVELTLKDGRKVEVEVEYIPQHGQQFAVLKVVETRNKSGKTSVDTSYQSPETFAKNAQQSELCKLQIDTAALVAPKTDQSSYGSKLEVVAGLHSFDYNPNKKAPTNLANVTNHLNLDAAIEMRKQYVKTEREEFVTTKVNAATAAINSAANKETIDKEMAKLEAELKQHISPEEIAEATKKVLEDTKTARTTAADAYVREAQTNADTLPDAALDEYKDLEKKLQGLGFSSDEVKTKMTKFLGYVKTSTKTAITKAMANEREATQIEREKQKAEVKAQRTKQALEDTQLAAQATLAAEQAKLKELEEQAKQAEASVASADQASEAEKADNVAKLEKIKKDKEEQDKKVEQLKADAAAKEEDAKKKPKKQESIFRNPWVVVGGAATFVGLGLVYLVSRGAKRTLPVESSVDQNPSKKQKTDR